MHVCGWWWVEEREVAWLSQGMDKASESK
jgi:hypothetical protein